MYKVSPLNKDEYPGHGFAIERFDRDGNCVETVAWLKEESVARFLVEAMNLCVTG